PRRRVAEGGPGVVARRGRHRHSVHQPAADLDGGGRRLALCGMSLAFRVEETPEIDSTNEACRRRALRGEPAGLVIRADLQTKGRGRRGRGWVSPPGNLYTSILLRPLRPMAEVATLGFVAVVALGDAIAPLPPPAVALRHKWPDDLLLDRSEERRVGRQGRARP